MQIESVVALRYRNNIRVVEAGVVKVQLPVAFLDLPGVAAVGGQAAAGVARFAKGALAQLAGFHPGDMPSFLVVVGNTSKTNRYSIRQNFLSSSITNVTCQP